MKNRTAVFGVLFSFLPIVQPLLISTGAFLTSTMVIFALPERTQAESGTYYYEQGFEKLFVDNDFYGAISDFTRAIEIDPNIAKYFSLRGRALAALEDYYAAISDFTRAIEIDPDEYDYLVRGNAKYELGDYWEAISDYNKALEIDSEIAVAYIMRSSSNYIMGFIEDACSDYNKAIEINPGFANEYRKHDDSYYINFKRLKDACSD